MNWINYLLEANLYMVLFYVVYYLFLRKETHYSLNRIYLLLSTLLAFIIPFLQIGMLKPKPVELPLAAMTHTYIKLSSAQQILNNTDATPAITINYYLLLYIAVVAILTGAFGLRLYQLIKLARKGKRTVAPNFSLVELDDDEQAFSFFNYLFIGSKLSTSNTVIQHELVHIRQKHSFDIVYLELLKIICWFNPAVYLLQNSLKEVHEFIADSQIAGTDQAVNDYTDFLISNAYGLPQTALTNNFFNKNLLKTRIMMLHQKRSGNLARLKYLVALPLFGGMLCLSTMAFTKDYNVVDLAPAIKPVVKLPNQSRLLVKENGISIITDKFSAKNNDGSIKYYTVASLTRADINALAKRGIDIKVISNVEITKIADAKQTLPPPPPPMPPLSITKKGFKYREDGYLVNGNTDFRVTILERNIEKTYFRSKATNADLKLLDKKYGYTFPSMEIHSKLPPPSIIAEPEVKVKGPNVVIAPPVVEQINEPQAVKTDTSFYSFYKHLGKYIRYPAAARNNNVQGKVFVIFNVNDDRSITNIFVARGLTNDINNEVVRVISGYKASAEFQTGVNYTVPVSMALQGDDGKYGDKYTGVVEQSTINQTYKKTGFKNVSLNEVVVVGYAAKK